MRHVGQELGLVLRGERQLGGFFLQRVAGLLDLGVLALDLGVLLGEQPGFGAQFLVGLLQLALARLQLDRELLRLRQQALGTHRRFDGIEHRADAERELIEEGEVDFGERLQRGQLDNRLGLALEQHGQHDNADLRRLAQAGGNADELRRHIGEQDALLFHGALAGEPLTKADRLGQLPALVRVARKQLELAACRPCRRGGRWCPGRL